MKDTLILSRKVFNTEELALAAIPALKEELNIWLRRSGLTVVLELKSSVWKPSATEDWHADAWVGCKGIVEIDKTDGGTE